MQKDLIRTDEERAARLQLVKANRLQRQEKLLAVAAAAAMTNGGGVVPTSTGHKYPRHSTSSSSSSSFEVKKTLGQTNIFLRCVVFRSLHSAVRLIRWKNRFFRHCRRTIGLN